ncbi:HTTM domain-containing protein, partial [Streptomyces cavourensis]
RSPEGGGSPEVPAARSAPDDRGGTGKERGGTGEAPPHGAGGGHTLVG